MDFLTFIAVVGLFLALFFFVGYPFFAFRPSVIFPAVDVQAWQLRERKEQVYAAIKEIEFDWELGKLSAEDYDHLRSQLEIEALALIRQLDRVTNLSGSATLKERLEREVLALRRLRSAAEEDRCPTCQAKRRPGDLFCSQCGAHFQGQP